MTKVEQKFQVAADSKISDIYGKLNSVQKQTVSLFDKDRNGVLDAKEAKAFNVTIFSEKKDKIDCWLQLQNGKKVKTTVLKKDIDTTVLELGKKEVATKQVGNKRIRYVQDRLNNNNNATSNKASIEARFAENSKGYDYESEDENGNAKYSRLLDENFPSSKEYVILNKWGEVVEKSEVLSAGGDSRVCQDWVDGHVVRGTNCDKYYDYKNKYIGSVKIENGRKVYTNNKNEVLYQVKEGNEKCIKCRNEYGGDYYRNIWDETYYDKEGNPLYKVEYESIDQSIGGYCKVYIYNKKGAVIKTVDKVEYNNYGDTGLEKFQKIRKNPVGNSFEGLALYEND